MTAKPPTDWEAIEREYRAGQLSVREIARQFGVTVGEIRKLELIHIGEGFRFDPDERLEDAKGQGFTNLVILGELPDGEVWVSGMANAGEALILIERAKLKIITPD